MCYLCVTISRGKCTNRYVNQQKVTEKRKESGTDTTSRQLTLSTKSIF